MNMKPKSTTLSPRALIFKRYIGINTATTTKAIYHTEDNKNWFFNGETGLFEEYVDYSPSGATIQVFDNTTVLKYKTDYFKYYMHKWVKVGAQSVGSFVNVKSSNIGKYDINKYYLAGSFDYVENGSKSESFTQPLKGTIAPLTSISIKHFNDYIDAKQDDLVVINNKLFVVESVEADHKHLPKDYYVYYLTLTSIL